jgi:hypothetical protein
MATMLKYTLKETTNISHSGFSYEIPEDTLNTINYLCMQVGSSIINSSLFIKPATTATYTNDVAPDFKKQKKRGNKGMEVSSDDWESIRNFQTTKIEQKTGIDGDINELRLYLNKLTDKTFLDMREKIIDKINSVCKDYEGDTYKIGIVLYDLCSTNRFYSKIFADLFAELAFMYDWLNVLFKEKYDTLMEQYMNINYVDSDKDYDGFCEMNKTNEKRRAITMFYLNLAINGFIPKERIVKLLQDLLSSIMSMINQPDKKNEVDELTEIVGIAFNREIIDLVDMKKEFQIMGRTIVDTISGLAKQKAKDYPSLSNKSIFKYMDLVEM